MRETDVSVDENGYSEEELERQAVAVDETLYNAQEVQALKDEAKQVRQQLDVTERLAKGLQAQLEERDAAIEHYGALVERSAPQLLALAEYQARHLDQLQKANR